MSACVRSAAELVATPVRWLWDRWLPAGKLVVLDGDPGTGKSTLACELAARLSRGGWGGEPSPVLLINAEDDPADTTVPRLVAAGADLARVHLWDPRDPLELPGGLDRLRAEIKRTGARLVVIDPLSAHLGRGANVSGDQSARRALTPLARLAEEAGCSVLLVRHLRKHAGDNPLYRGLGSVGVIAAVRVAWLLGYHPGGEERRVLTMTKSNLGPVPGAKVFRVADGRVAWAADEEWLSAADVIRSTATSVSRWLSQLLERGPKKSDRVKAEAAAAGISERTLWRAKQSMRVMAKKYYGNSYWCLPGQDPRERYFNLEPIEAVAPTKDSGLGPVDDGATMGPVADGPRLGSVREDMSEREILRQAKKAARAAGERGRVSGPMMSPSGALRPAARPDEEGEPSGVSRRVMTGCLDAGGERSGVSRPIMTPSGALRPAARQDGEGEPSRGSGPMTAAPSPSPETGGERDKTAAASRSRAAGSRRFDPAPAGTLDVVLRLGDAGADWAAAVTDRLFQFAELVQARVGESAGFDWEPAWTGPLGEGRFRLVLAPREVPADRLASLSAWAQESLGPCESARLAA
jgi:hypothetical protein